MKKFLIGFLVGAIVFSVIGTFAVSYVAEPATFKVLVNGEEFHSEPPALVIEGRTYLPLRAMGDALGVPVEWNAELNQAEVGDRSISAVQENTLFGYKTYEESNAIIDFGAFCGAEPCVKPIIEDEYTCYEYTWDETKDKVLEYMKLMQKNGYSFSIKDGGVRTTYMALNQDFSKPAFSIITGMPENFTTLDMYVSILITK